MRRLIVLLEDPSKVGPKQKPLPFCRGPLVNQKYGELIHGGSHCASISGRNLFISDAEIFVWIDRNVVNAHLIVKVRAGRASRLADIADHLASGYVLAGQNRHGGEMPVNREQVVAAVGDDRP